MTGILVQMVLLGVFKIASKVYERIAVIKQTQKEGGADDEKPEVAQVKKFPLLSFDEWKENEETRRNP